MPLSSDDARTLGYLGGVAAIIGIGGYAAYKIFNPSVKGGDCKTAGSPCNSALQPYQQQLQACTDQYTQLITQIAQGGQAPTDAQKAALDQLRNCMDDASANIANVAKQFVPSSSIDTILADIGEAILISSVAYFGLKGLASFIKTLRAQGKVNTSSSNGAGMASQIADSSIMYAVDQGLINSSVESAWRQVVSDFSASNIVEVESFYQTLAVDSIITQDIASALISQYTASIAADANFAIESLSLVLGYAAYAPGCVSCY